MSYQLRRCLIALFAACSIFIPVFGLAFSAPRTIYTVNSFDDLPDGLPGDGACATNPPPTPVCTLRAAVQEANAHPGPDFIALSPGTYTLTRVGYDNNALNGDLDVTDDLTIFTTGGIATIDANGSVTFDRAFEVITGTLSLSDITIVNGYSPSNGGGISANGNLQMYNTIVQDNTSALDGGGIFAAGAMVSLSSVTLRGNHSQQAGGGISIEGSSAPYPNVFVSDSTVEGNRALAAGSSGGAVNIYTAGGGINNSTFRDNTAGQGGALNYTAAVVGVRLDITQSTFISNSAVTNNGGALYLYGNTSLNSSQVMSNVAPSAGGIYAYFGTHTLNDVRVTYNQATSYACGGIEVSSGNLNINRGWVQSNSAPEIGGGLCTGGAGSIRMAITDTNVLNNNSGNGGGIWVGNSFIASRSAIYNNFATRGGGIFALGYAVVENSTVSGNSAVRDGGGIYADPSSGVQLNSATIESNHAHTIFSGLGTGGGMFISNTAAITVANTLIGYNTNSNLAISYNDCAGTLYSQGYNLISTNSGCATTGDATGNQIGGASPFGLINPKVDALAMLTGLTPGHLLHSDSPLIDAAAPIGCQSALPPGFLFIDQIGHYRAANGRCDIGAVEYFDIRRLYLPLVTR